MYESSSTQIVTSMGSVFMSPRAAMKKQCVMHGAPEKPNDDDMLPYESEPERVRLCIAKKCMNWREHRALGFCDLSIPHEVRVVMLEEYLSR